MKKEVHLFFCTTWLITILIAGCDKSEHPSSEAVLVTGISLDHSTARIEMGKMLQLTVTVTPENASDKTVIFKSGDESVALVDESGHIAAVGIGETVVTATTQDGSFTASCEVEVWDKYYIAIVTAYSGESWLIEQNIIIDTTEYINGIQFNIGQLSGKDVVFYESGMYLDKAESSTIVLLDHFNISMIIFSGGGGGINPDIRIGDVSVSERWAKVDNHPDPNQEGFWTYVDSNMLATAVEITNDVELLNSHNFPENCELGYDPVVLTGGSGVSYFDTFVSYNDSSIWAILWNKYAANTIDNETSAIAQVAHEQGIPFLAFRAANALDGRSNPDDHSTYWALAANNAAIAAMAFLKAWVEY